MSNFPTRFLPLMAAFPLLACGDSEPAVRAKADDASVRAPVAGGESPRPPAIDPGSPSYEVPVSGELADFAVYPVDAVEWSERKGERRLEYTLPADLIGTAQRLEFKGSESAGPKWNLAGEEFGTAECELMAGQIVCLERLAGVPIDLDAIEARVRAGELPPERLEISKVFQGDPLGVLRFPAP